MPKTWSFLNNALMNMDWTDGVASPKWMDYHLPTSWALKITVIKSLHCKNSYLGWSLKLLIVVTLVVILPISSISCIFSEPIIHVLFERRAFGSSARVLVSSLFFLYSLGSPFFILRELLVVVFYAFGDGKGPFLVNTRAIILNALLDWLLIPRYYLGAQGLALSTSFTTALSVLVLFYLLQRKLAGVVDLAALVRPVMLLLFCCVVSSLRYIHELQHLQHVLFQPKQKDLFDQGALVRGVSRCCWSLRLFLSSCIASLLGIHIYSGFLSVSKS